MTKIKFSKPTVFEIVQWIVLIVTILLFLGLIDSGGKQPEEGESPIPLILAVFAIWFVIIPNIAAGIFIVLVKLFSKTLHFRELAIFVINISIFIYLLSAGLTSQ